MKEQPESRFRLATYNIGGGRDDFGSMPGAVTQVIKEISPDILVLQEATDYQDADGSWHSILSQIAASGEFGKYSHFGPTLSLREHMHVRKDLFVHSIFSDHLDWRQGNAILSRWGFVRLGDSSRPGTPRNVPVYRTPLYRGSRDTDPRYALLSRINRAPLYPFVVGVHLTTLVAERERDGGGRPVPGRVEEAEILRFKQARRLLDLLEEHVLEPQELVFLLGDFNAAAGEPCITSVLEREGGFTRLVPDRDQSATHSEAAQPIDHIFVYPEDRLMEYRCWIVASELAQQASDHLPVVADVTVC